MASLRIYIYRLLLANGSEKIRGFKHDQQTTEEMLQVSGIGEAKLQRYGQEFLDVILKA